MSFHEGTLAVVRRRLLSLLDLDFYDDKLYYMGVFDAQAGETTLKDISNELERGKTVIVDTSPFSGAVEILIGSLVASEIPLARISEFTLVLNALAISTAGFRLSCHWLR